MGLQCSMLLLIACSAAYFCTAFSGNNGRWNIWYLYSRFSLTVMSDSLQLVTSWFNKLQSSNTIAVRNNSCAASRTSMLPMRSVQPWRRFMIWECSSTHSFFDIRLKRVLGRSLDGRRIDLKDGRSQKSYRPLEAGWFSCVASESD
jgi:hypothetical protein